MNNSLEIGSELRSPNNKYIIRSVLGKGGFGITYSATFSTVVGGLPIKAVVAIKEHFLSADCERESSTQSVSYSQPVSERVERSRRDFVGEARRLQAVASGHNNIVQVSEVFDANNTSYYVMEFLEGQSLSEYIKEKGALSEQETMSIMQPIVDAVAYLHENKITHLDIKPGNIMLSHDQNDAMRPVLIDFGLSKHYNEDGSATSTINTQGFSDGFAPIEQYVGITSFSPVSDVYSLAATILYCLTGQRPPKSLELTPAYLQENIPSSVSQNLRDMLFASMQMSAASRPSDASVMLAMLDLHSDDLATSPDSASPAIATPTAAKAESKEKISSDSEQTALIGSEETRTISADESTRIVADKAAASKPQSTYTPPPPPPSTPSQKATLTVDDDEQSGSKLKNVLWISLVFLLAITVVGGFIYYLSTQSEEDSMFPSSYTYVSQVPVADVNGDSLVVDLTHHLIFYSPDSVIWSIDVQGTQCPVAVGRYIENNTGNRYIEFTPEDAANSSTSILRHDGEKIIFYVEKVGSDLVILPEHWQQDWRNPDSQNIINTYPGSIVWTILGMNRSVRFTKDESTSIPEPDMVGTIWKMSFSEEKDYYIDFISPTMVKIVEHSNDGYVFSSTHNYLLINGQLGITSGDNLFDEFIIRLDENTIKRSCWENSENNTYEPINWEQVSYIPFAN